MPSSERVSSYPRGYIVQYLVLDSVICVLEACGVVVLYFRRLIYYLLIERVYP